MYPHRIRLRGPWEYEAIGRMGEAPLSGRLLMPCAPADLEQLEISGRFRFRRRFGYPGRIDTYERVWLVFDGLPEAAELTLNGSPLDLAGGQAELDVTGLLQSRNELLVEVVVTAGLWEEAALEVRCQAYLRGVKATLEEGRIHARGEVVGQADGPLELYLIGDRSSLAYAKVSAEKEIQSFDLCGEPINRAGEPIGRVKIDLVKGAAVWYTLELDVPTPMEQNPRA